MKNERRIFTALSGGKPDRVPSVPKIWVDSAARLTETNILDVITDPLAALRVIADAAVLCKCDAARQFHFPRRSIEATTEAVYEVDQGERIGEIDMKGGLSTKLYDSSNFRLEDLNFTAYHHYWTSDRPFVASIEDAHRIAVPEKTFFEENGCGDRQRAVVEQFGDALTLIGDCSSATMAYYVCMRGLNNAMIDLIEEPALVHAVMEKGVATAVAKGKFNIDMGLKILRLNDSVGNMSVISPSHWREYVFPHMKEVCDELHAYDPEVRVYCHICGNILPIAEDLVATGLDCIGPLDPLGGMTAGQIRRVVGDSVALMGGVNTMSFIDSHPEGIVEEARRCIAGAGTQGGYILGSGCVIPPSTKRENLLALHDAALKYGVYEA